MSDTYKTIAAETPEVLYKEKGSKFFSYAFPVTSADEVKQHLEDLRKLRPGAVHYCYAYQIGAPEGQYRYSDDGEPANTAGAPIYGQIQSHELTNVLIVVVRFFGGIKLGVGGLISAYRTSAQMALAEADIEERTIEVFYVLRFDYKNLNKVMRLLRERQLKLVSQTMELECELKIGVRLREESAVVEALGNLYGLSFEKWLSDN